MTTREELHDKTIDLLGKCVAALEKRMQGTADLPFLTDGENLACRFILNAYKASLVEAGAGRPGQPAPMPDLPQGALGPALHVDLKDVTPEELLRISRVA